MAERGAGDGQQAGARAPLKAVVARAFHRLLATGQPVAPATLADDLGVPVADVEATLVEADDASRVRRFRDGAVHGAAGLSVVPTRHLLRVDGSGPRYTWCGYDAIGILAALEATGHAVSASPWSGRSIDIPFTGGRLVEPEGAILFLAERPGDVPARDWCPYVNIFESTEEARRWAREFGIDGRVLPLEEARTMGVEHWAPVVGG